jgi:hypothetical protein
MINTEGPNDTAIIKNDDRFAVLRHFRNIDPDVVGDDDVIADADVLRQRSGKPERTADGNLSAHFVKRISMREPERMEFVDCARYHLSILIKYGVIAEIRHAGSTSSAPRRSINQNTPMTPRPRACLFPYFEPTDAIQFFVSIKRTDAIKITKDLQLSRVP